MGSLVAASRANTPMIVATGQQTRGLVGEVLSAAHQTRYVDRQFLGHCAHHPTATGCLQKRTASLPAAAIQTTARRRTGRMCVES